MRSLLLSFILMPALVSCNSATENQKKQNAEQQPVNQTQTGEQSQHENNGSMVPMTSGKPWTDDQLLAPAALAQRIEDGSAPKYIFNIGPSGAIKGSIEIGSTQSPANLEKLKAALGNVPQDAEVVVYCGCCPFANCPNIRPTFEALNDMGYKNAHLLNLSQNLKTNWIDQGYPME